MTVLTASVTYGRPPLVNGVLRFDAWQEFMHYLYLPVRIPGHQGVRIPRRLAFLGTIVEQIIEAEDWDGFVYVSARRGHASPGNPLNRPGWHADGFGTEDINYVWADRYPTRFAVQEFTDVGTDHVVAAERFDAQIDPDSIVTYPDGVLLRLDPTVVHSVPEIPPPGGLRTFLKVSLSHDKYNLVGNSHNHLFEYDWRMFTREEIRNDPAYAGDDAGPA